MPEQQKKSRKTVKFIHPFEKKKERNSREFTKTRQNADNKHEAKLPIQISHLSAQVQVFRKAWTFESFAPFLLF